MMKERSAVGHEDEYAVNSRGYDMQYKYNISPKLS